MSNQTDPGLNLVVLHGHLSSDPRQRSLPSGDDVWSYEVTTRTDDGRASSVPVVLGKARPPSGLSAGDAVLLVGSVRRRFFRAGGRTASRTEVVADRLVRSTRRSSLVAGLDLAEQALAEHRQDQVAG